MNQRRLAVAVIGSVLVVTMVVVIILAAMIPLPAFADLPRGRFDEVLVFVDEDNCIYVADLGPGTITELRCEPEPNWIEHLAWTSNGIEETTYRNGPTIKVLDPDTGQILETRVGDETSEPPVTDDQFDGMTVDRPEEGKIVIYDETGNTVLSLDAPERYWIQSVTSSSDGELIAFADSAGRLGVFEPGGEGPYLVAEDVRGWPPPAWAP
jgi:hypothetical protein